MPALCFFTPIPLPRPSHSPPTALPRPSCSHPHLLPHLHPHSATSSSSATPHFEDNPPHFPLHSSPSPPRITSRQPLTTSLPHVVLPGHLRLLRLNSWPRKLCLAPPMRFLLFSEYQCFTRIDWAKFYPVDLPSGLINNKLQKTPAMPRRAAAALVGNGHGLLSSGQLPRLSATGTPAGSSQSSRTEIARNRRTQCPAVVPGPARPHPSPPVHTRSHSAPLGPTLFFVILSVSMLYEITRAKNRPRVFSYLVCY